jgi:hypothetical protein
MMSAYWKLFRQKTYQNNTTSDSAPHDQCYIDNGKKRTLQGEIINFKLDFQFLMILGDPPCDPPPPGPHRKNGVRKRSSTENQVSVMYYDLLNFEADPISLSMRSNSDKKS